MSIADKLSTVAENVSKVYESGYGAGYGMGIAAGYSDGVDAGIEMGIAEGKQAEYDAFWDAYQSNGNRSNYQYAFYRSYWKNTTNYKPKYPIKVSSNMGSNMFNTSGVTDTVVPITLSGAHGSVFYDSSVRTIPYLDVSGVTATMADWFTGCDDLANITMVGVIPQNMNFKNCPLTAESLVNIVEHLSTSATNKTLTLNSDAVANADWSTTEYTSWDELIATKKPSGWSVSLVTG